MPEAICAWTDVQEAGGHFRDIGNATGDFCCGVGNAVKDFITGIAGLLGGLIEIMLYAEYSNFPMNLVPVPEWLDRDIQNMKDTFVQVIKDPGNVLESIGQGMFDTADEKGTAYSSGYVAGDVVIAILTDKGLDKLKEAGKAGKTTANVADDVADVADDAARAGKEAGETARNAEAVAEGLEGKAGKVLGGGIYSLPQGISQEQFSSASKLLRDKVGNISDDIVVQGSRASGTAKATSDIDIALRVSSDKFDELINQYFKTPNPGSAKERTMLHAIQTGKIQSGEAKLKALRLQLQDIFGMDVDISVIKIGGSFDNPPFIPFE